MSKRLKSDTLTGGSGDVNKNFFWFDHTIPSGQVAAVNNVANIQLPIPPYLVPPELQQNYVAVAELISANMLIDGYPTLYATLAGTNGFGACVQLGSTPPGRICSTNAAVASPGHVFETPATGTFFRLEEYSSSSAYTAAGAGLSRIGPGNTGGDNWVDFTDKAGHGIVLYGNNLYSTFVYNKSSGGLSQQVVVRWCISYRIKNIPLTEYVQGINMSPSSTS